MSNEKMSQFPHTEAPDRPDASRLAILGREPLNAETVLSRQTGVITPNPAFYVRNHFTPPALHASTWRLTIGGEVKQPIELSYADVQALPRRTLLSVLECAGNGRAGFHPKAEGEAWQYGAVSMAEWSGAPLRAVLEAAGVLPTAREVVIEGGDQGYVPDAKKTLKYARSLPLAQALHPDTLLAYAMNGEALPLEHGFPVRLLVPGWYGMASVKWVTRIETIAHPFQGFYQVDRYIMAHPERGESGSIPLTLIGVRSLITTPTEGARLARGRHLLRGFAWSGAAPVDRVEVSDDGGATWQPAAFTSAPSRYGWRGWEYAWQAATPGPHILQSRAFDEAGNAQPAQPEWNRLGYANNAPQQVQVVVT